MRFILGFLAGVLGMLAGWVGLAALVISMAGPDRDGGIAMGAFFNIGPLGGIIGFVAGVVLFIKLGMTSERISAVDENRAGDEFPSAKKTRVSPTFAIVILALSGSISWWAWYELIRSPYLTHGFMTLELQFRLPPGMALPPEATDVHISVLEGKQEAGATLGPSWHGTDGGRRVILARSILSLKTSRRVVNLELPGLAEQTWRVDLPSDPDPMPGYSPWRFSSNSSAPKIEMNYHLGADR